MKGLVTCQVCGEQYSFKSRDCPHCDAPGEYYPNVTQAKWEESALRQRYDVACNRARTRSIDLLLQQLQDAVDQQSWACINRDYLEVRTLAKKDRAYASYYLQIAAGMRLRGGDKWEKDREVADTLFFPGFKEHIRFAALTLNEQGVDYYGPCCLLLKEEMIRMRATLFHENTLQFMIKNNIRAADPLPKGLRAVWLQKGMLAAAKLEEELSSTSTAADFPQLLVRQGPAGKGEDVFLEVHIYGSLTIQSAKEITFPANPPPHDAADAGLLERELQARQIACRRIV
jgi:hypothetical protein